MPRQVRIEYAGAFYHVMARGNRRGDIVFDDEDRKTFLRTLGEVCKRAGFRIHAYALMSNHYHLLLETPQANLTAGMGWFQNAYTRRINTRHRLWGIFLVEDTRRSWWNLEMPTGRFWTTFI
jgi:REP element-mobilizing transposase RayT